MASTSTSAPATPEAATITAAAADTPRLCALCGEFDAASGCAAGHIMCAPCVTACVRATEKLLGPMEIPPVCPIGNCSEMLIAPSRYATKRRIARLTRLTFDDADYTDVLNAFGKTMDANLVSEIYRIDNPALRALHETCRERMNREGRVDRRPPEAVAKVKAPRRGKAAAAAGVAPDDTKNVGANERRLFHATTRFAAGAIIREGFDAHRAGQAHGTALGPGIYVATNASFSHMYSSEDSVGTRAMLVCNVLLGDTSGRDSNGGGDQFAVHREQQVLPTHLIYYRDR